MSERTTESQWEAAYDLAEANGCSQMNSCWGECVEAALYEILETQEAAPLPKE